MPRMLAVDWDRHEARYVLGTTGRGKVKVHAVQSVPLVDVAERGHEPEPDLSGSLAAALSEQKVGRTSALVGVERSSLEILHLTLPPARDSELAELVAHQAMRESQFVGEQSVLDFVPLSDDAAAPRSVLVAALAREELERIEAACSAAGLKPARMLLRPLAAASLFLRTAAPAEEACLLVNRITDEVDLTILVDRRPVFFRTVRLPEGASPAQLTSRLLAEINRTLAAAPQTHLGPETVECVYLFGRRDDHQALVARIRDDLFLPAKVVDPFEALGVDEELIPEDSGRFAPLLGMLLDEAAGSHALDFLHPRKKPQPIPRGRIALVAAGLVLAVVLGIAYNAWSTWSEIAEQNQLLASQIQQLDATAKKAEKRQRLIDAVARWKDRDIVWLDELRDLSLRFPSARDVVVLRMSMVQSQAGGGAVDLEGLVRDPKIVANIEGRVRDGFRSVRSRRVQERRLEKDYTWLFETSMAIARRPPEVYASQLPPSGPVAAQAARAEQPGGSSRASRWQAQPPQEPPARGREKPQPGQRGPALAEAGTAQVLPPVERTSP